MLQPLKEEVLELNKKISDSESSKDPNASLVQGVNNVNDAFLTDSIQLIGLIYKFAKAKNISAGSFEQIIANSYDVAWKNQDKKG